jgi:hypothetical protein
MGGEMLRSSEILRLSSDDGGKSQSLSIKDMTEEQIACALDDALPKLKQCLLEGWRKLDHQENLHDATTIQEIAAKMKKNHLDLVRTITQDLTISGFPFFSLKPLHQHTKTHEKIDGQWYRAGNNLKEATRLVLAAKQMACARMLGIVACSAPMADPSDQPVGAISLALSVLLAPSTSADIRRDACIAVARLKEAGAAHMEAITNTLNEDKDGSVRSAALEVSGLQVC